MALFPPHSEISCKSLEGREGLRQLIFHVTCSMKDVGSTIGCQRLAGRLVGAWLIPPEPGGACFPPWGPRTSPCLCVPRLWSLSERGLGGRAGAGGDRQQTPARAREGGGGQAGGLADAPRTPPAARCPGAT